MTLSEITYVEGLPTLSATDPIVANEYTIKSTEVKTLVSPGAGSIAEVWFKSPPLSKDIISHLQGLQLFAESHDQGKVANPAAGNWTWLELAIFENAESALPRIKDGVQLVWKSHRNRFQTDTYGWVTTGKLFGSDSNLLNSLEENNVVAVRICAQFPGWSISVRTGYLVFNIAEDPIEREPPKLGQVLSQVNTIQDALVEVNTAIGVGFQPHLPEHLVRADTVSSEDNRPLRVLSLDGGGARGLSSLMVLKAAFDKAGITKPPCEVFDMIAGTSTGGLIAIMLGRLKMGIQECIDEYNAIMPKVFPPRKALEKMFHVAAEFSWNASDLENEIKRVVKKKNLDEDAKLLDEDNPCKVFVMAVRADALNNHAPVYIRSYTNKFEQSLLPDIKIWEAARATSAAPTYFEPMKIGDYTLVDGGLEANNPLGWLWIEAISVHSATRPIDCFLSIGTGIGANVALPDDWRTSPVQFVGAVSSASTNTEVAYTLFRVLINAFAAVAGAKKYFRFNVGKAVEGKDDFEKIPEMDDITGVLGAFKKMTEDYLVEPSTVTLLDTCGKALIANLQ